MNKLVKEISEEDRRVVCDFCHKFELNTLEWGPMYQFDGVTTHYFCMLFSCGLSQNGEDSEGILGFLPKDIKKEIRRGNNLKCKFCKLNNATIGCSVKTCKTSYHYVCGLEEGSGFHFIDNWESYCSKHKEKLDIPFPEIERECPICFCDVEENALWPPCCKKRIFHKRCILEMAKTAGIHFFKCPLCNDKDVFSVAMRRAGVYLPDRDAAWETEPQAFEDLNRLHNRCDAEECECPKGRDHCSKSDSKPWHIVRCGGCGSFATHKQCGRLKNLTWRCPTCTDILSNSRIQRHQFDLSSDDEEDTPSDVQRPRDIIQSPTISSAISISSMSLDLDASSEDENRRTKTFYDRRYKRDFLIEATVSDSSDDEGEPVIFAPLTNLPQHVHVQKGRVGCWNTKIVNQKFGCSQIDNDSEFATSLLSTSMNSVHLDVADRIRAYDKKIKHLFEKSSQQTTEKEAENQASFSGTTGNIEESDSSDSDNDSMVRDRDLSTGNAHSASLRELGKDTLIKSEGKLLMKGKIELQDTTLICKESNPQIIKISRKGIFLTSEDSQEPVVNTLLENSGSTPTEEANVVKPDVDSKKSKAERQEPDLVDLEEEDSDSDLEIVSEKITTHRTAAMTEILNKLNNNGFKKNPVPLVRLGFDDHQNDDIDIVFESVKKTDEIEMIGCNDTGDNGEQMNKDSLAFNPNSTLFPISSAFLQVVKETRRKNANTHFSGQLSVSGKNSQSVIILDSDDEECEEKSAVVQGRDPTGKIKRDRKRPSIETTESASSFRSRAKKARK